MSLIFTETFCGNEPSASSYGPTTKWQSGSAAGESNVNARTNGRVRRSGLNHVELERRLSTADEHATLIAGMALRWGNSAPFAETELFTFKSDAGATTHVTVTINADGKIRAYRGLRTGTLLGTSTINTIMRTTGTWYYAEAKATLSDGGGSVEVKIDGTTVLALSGVDTKNGGTKTVFDSMMISFGQGGSGAEALCCDVYICNAAGSRNNTFLNCPKILFLAVTGNGSSSQGVGSDGNSTNNYDLVDEAAGVAPNETDYVDLVATGDKDLYAVADPPADPPATNIVRGAMVWSWAKKTDPTSRSVIHVAKSGGSQSDAGPAALIEGIYTAVNGAIETKPGGGAWTVADLAAMEFGIKAGA
jgi:hypothetical protein